jgi:IrrE N-terminal-like domain
MATVETPLFRFDWIPAPDDMRSEELRSTCARLEINLHGERPTYVEDAKTNSARHSILVPMYSLAEWLAFTWWQFFQVSNEGMVAETIERPEMARRRFRTNMRSIGDGYVWPNLTISRDGDLMRVTWQGDRARDARHDIRYLSTGTEHLSVGAFQESAGAVIGAVITHLDEEGIGPTNLHEEWSALLALDTEEAEFASACGRLGLDPFSEGLEFAEQIESAFESLDGVVFDELVDAADPGTLVEDLRWIESSDAHARKKLSEDVSQSQPMSLDLKDFLKNGSQELEVPNGARPYQIGYEQARAVRRAIGLEPTAALPTAAFPISVGLRSLSDRGLAGYSVLSKELDRGFVVASSSHRETGKRFLLARGLWHAMFANQSDHLLITTSASRTQQITRAFAAELLAPAEGIRRLLPRSVGTYEIIADHFRVSDVLVRYQTQNQVEV